MSATALQQIEGMEESREEIFKEMMSQAVGSKDRSISKLSIDALTNLIDYHRKRLSKIKPKKVRQDDGIDL